MKKKLISVLMAMALILTLFTGAFAVKTPPEEASANSASVLYGLGLLRGTGADEYGRPVFELERPMTRQEAVVMLVRLTGGEDAALSKNITAPFTDVDAWARPYVGYAWAFGLTYGIGDNLFGGNEYITASQYLTFILRTLGYSSGLDFEWDSAWTLADSIGLTSGEYSGESVFLRSGAADISLKALSLTLKGSMTTLVSKLLKSGAVNSKAVAAAGLSSVLSSEVFAKAEGTIFSITSFDASGNVLSSGSGFFIDSSTLDSGMDKEGIAVTSWRVLKNASSAVITVSSGERYDVIGFYGFSDAADLTVIKVNGTGFKSLQIQNFVDVSEGSYVFNPASLTQGTVSYVGGLSNGVSHIRSAALNSGNCGNPLMDVYGKVVGISSAAGQDLSVKASWLRLLNATGFMTFSRETGYTTYPLAPDFGAYFGFYPERVESSENGTVYLYSLRKVMAAKAGAADMYDTLLKKWGFRFSGDYYGIYSQYAIYQKDGLTLTFGTEIQDGSEYFRISIR